MILKRQLTILLTAIIILMPATLFANYQDQLDLESNITDKAQHILDSMYGKHKFAVVTRVSLGNESWRVRYTERANIKKTNKDKDVLTKEYLVLPGYTAVKNAGADVRNQLPFNSEITKRPAAIRRIVIELVVSKEVSKTEAKKAGKLLTKALVLNPERGDEIIYNFQTFAIAAQRTGSNENAEAGPTGPREKSDWVLLTLISSFILVYMIMQSKLIKKMATAGSGDGGGAAALAPAPAPSSGSGGGDMEKLASLLGAGGGGGSKDDSMKHYFNFITPFNVTSVMTILQNEKLGVQYVAIILSYLNADVASKILNAYPANEQGEIITNMIDQKTLKKEMLDKLENQIRAKLECTVGGEETAGALFTYIPNNAKQEILNMLQKDPEKYQKIRQNVILFDDIKVLTAPEIQKITSEANLDMVSAALMGCAKETYNKIYGSLSGPAKAMTKQFADLKGKAITKGEIELAQVYLLDIATRMDGEGKIELKSKLSKG